MPSQFGEDVGGHKWRDDPVPGTAHHPVRGLLRGGEHLQDGQH